MRSPGVQQLDALADLFKSALQHCMPESVAILGIAGGNGLEHINAGVTQRILGLDINECYLDTVKRRFGTLPGLELHCHDLRDLEPGLDQFSLVHCALIFEHTGLDPALENALSLVAPEGRLSVVLQLANENCAPIAGTSYHSIDSLKQNFTLIQIETLVLQLASKEFHLTEHVSRLCAGGKALWMGIFDQAKGEGRSRIT